MKRPPRINWIALLALMVWVSSTFARAEEGVILLHGLCRSSASMNKMADALEKAGFKVVNVNYPSRTANIRTLSEDAIGAALIDPILEECTQIHFVTHSLGGILVRSYYSRHESDKLRRVVMLGPPNQGSEVVDKLHSWRLFQKLNGPAGSELGTDSQSTPNQLGPVEFDLGVIAGNRSINWINSLMIDGPDDGKVSVDRTKVEGMKAHIILPATHPFLMKNTEAINQTLTFLQSGSFKTEADE